jgi:Leucine-rich repeat (LRR) protein
MSVAVAAYSSFAKSDVSWRNSGTMITWKLKEYNFWIDQGCPLDDRIITLDLKNSNAVIVPEIENIRNMQVLDISNNNLKHLEPSIFNLTNLQVLIVSNNQLSEISPLIGNLKNLRSLYVDSNKLTTLPTTLGTLRKLRTFGFSGNKHIVIPAAIRHILY